MRGLDTILRGQKLFAGLGESRLALLAGCARNHRFKPGDYLFREGDAASEFFLIRNGHVALEMLPPGGTPFIFATLGPGEIVGASWLSPPYRWSSDARAVETTHALGLDAACLRGKCDADPALGYEMMQRFLPVLVSQIHAAQLQIMNVYGRH